MFQTILNSALKALPVFATHFLLTLVILVIGVLVYQAITPQNEAKLIRSNNQAAAVAFAAVILSLALPLGMCLARSVSLADIAVWGTIALVIQLGTFLVARIAFRDLVKRIEAGEMASAIALGATHLAVGAINAAAIAG